MYINRHGFCYVRFKRLIFIQRHPLPFLGARPLDESKERLWIKPAPHWCTHQANQRW
jgi:hypothetical protein